MKLNGLGKPVTIGVDFDNTLITYDVLIHRIALERGLIGSKIDPNKKQMRDSIRELPGGDVEWQKLQALIYGPLIHEATPAPGSAEFLEECFRNCVKVNIVSHKTQFANYDETGTNLRCAALSWLDEYRYFNRSSYGLSSNDVYFESTRKEKLGRIHQLRCTHFIDDLEETFMEDTFPLGVSRLLYCPQIRVPAPDYVELAGDWKWITDNLFHAQE